MSQLNWKTNTEMSKRTKPLDSFFKVKKADADKKDEKVTQEKEDKPTEETKAKTTKGIKVQKKKSEESKGSSDDNKTLPFEGLANTFDKIENESGRIAKTNVMADYLVKVLKECPSDLSYICYLTTGQIAPGWEGKELGVGDSILKKAFQKVTSMKPSDINAKIKEYGDLGLVAQKSKKSQTTLVKPKPITIRGLIQKMNDVLECDSNDKKIQIITGLLVAANGVESKCILRILKGSFRIKFTEKSLPSSFAQALVKVHGVRKEFSEEEDTKELTELIKQAIARTPCFELIMPFITAKNPFVELKKASKITIFIPFRPMLAKPRKSVTEITAKFGTKFTCEYKYDGERGQIHYNKGEVRIFTRGLEDYSSKYPDVIQTIKKAVNKDVESFIIDSEIVAYDREKDTFREFQILGRRARKDVSIHEIAINVCVNAFDILYLNGQDISKKLLLERREILHKTFHEVNQEFLFAKYKNIESEDDIIPFFDEAVAHHTEGLMCKTTDNTSVYIPDKRSDTWYKLKKDYLSGLSDTVALVVIGACNGDGKRKGVYGAFLMACYNKKQDVYESVTKVGTGFSDEVLQDLFNSMKEFATTKQSVQIKHPGNKPDVWFDPKFVWEIKGADLSLSLEYCAAIKSVNTEKRGVCLRFPRFVRVRDDKRPEDATVNDIIYKMYTEQPSIRGDGKTDGTMKKGDESDSESSED